MVAENGRKRAAVWNLSFGMKKNTTLTQIKKE